MVPGGWERSRHWKQICRLRLSVVAEHEAETVAERTGIEDATGARLYVTVRATPNPLDITANLRAPLVVHEGRGYQVINANPEAQLQAPLFVLSDETTRIAS